MSFPSRLVSLTGGVAALLFVLSVVGFGLALHDYSQAIHPVTWLGAHGIPHARGFNLIGLVLPGVLAAGMAEGLRRRLPATAGWGARIGCQMLLLAGLAFAAMGLLPLHIDDLADMQGPDSQLHVAAWMIWALAFITGTVLLAVTRLRDRAARPLAGLALGCGLLAALAAFGLQGVVPAALAQRLAFACWVVWLALALPLAGRR